MSVESRAVIKENQKTLVVSRELPALNTAQDQRDNVRLCIISSGDQQTFIDVEALDLINSIKIVFPELLINLTV